MWCGVLGPLVVRGTAAQPLTISGPARRLLFAALVSRAGRTVSPDVLIEDLWGHVPPRTAAKTLQSHVVRLRTDLGRDPALVTDRTGYRLEVEPGDVDAQAFELGVREAAERAAAGDSAGALSRLDAALDLWRGDAYEEFADAAFCVAERVRLTELRAHAEEERTEAALRLGRADDLIADLEKRVAAAPYRERTWEQLVLALYRAGRQADALGAYRRARNTLGEDLGVDPGPRLQRLEERILLQDPTLLADADTARPKTPVSPRPDVCPYRGLASYREGDEELFVGRERLTAELVGMLAEHRVIAVVGASGTGKSSLLRAGLVPALRSGALPGSAAWRLHVATPADAAGAAVFGDADVVVLDQAEDLFVQLAPDVRSEFVDRVGQFTGAGGRLVFALRADFYGRLPEAQPLGVYAQDATVLVGPLREDELRRVVVDPAERVGLHIESALVEAVLDDVAGQPAALPLLSAALVRTWQNRDGNRLTLDGYRRGGGVESALEATADDVYVRLPEPQRVAARRLLVRLAGREGDSWVRRPMRRSDAVADEDSRAVIDAFSAARLLAVGQDRVEITHDALLAHWPRLRGWLDERVLAADLLDHLAVATRAWSDAGRPDSDLYRGTRLQAALDWRSDHSDDISPAEGEFLDAAEAAGGAELSAAREQVAREVRGRRRLRLVAAGLAVMVVLAAVGIGIALHERGSANAAARRARAAALTADSRRLAALSANAPDIATSSLLAVAAYRLQNSVDSRGALLAAVERNQSALWRYSTKYRLLRVAATPDGRRLAAMDNRREVHVIDPRTRRQVAQVNAQGENLDGITADGRQLIVYGPTAQEEPIGRLSLVDVATGRRVRVLTTAGVMDPEIEPAESDDDHWLALLTDQHLGPGRAIDVFDATNWAAPPLRFAVPRGSIALAAAPHAVAVQRPDGSIEVRSLPSLTPLGSIPSPFPVSSTSPPTVSTIAVSADGSRLASLDIQDQRRIAISDVLGHHPTVSVPTQNQDIAFLAFSPDDADLALTTLGGAVAVYRTSDGVPSEALAGHAGPALGVTWTGTGKPTGLYTVGLDSELVSWSVTSQPRLVTLSGADLVSPDRAETFGHFLFGLTPQQGGVPASQEKLFRADLVTGRWETWPLGLADGEYVNQAMASRDGSRGVVSIQDQAGHNRVEIWDLVRHVRVGTLALPADAPKKFVIGFNAAMSPDGRTAYCNLGGSRVGVFDLPSGRYVRSFGVHFADPDSARVVAVPWRFSPDGRLLVYGFDSGPHPHGGPFGIGPNDSRPSNQRLGILDPARGRLIVQTGLGDIGEAMVAEWSRDGRLFALGTSDGAVTLFDAHTLAVVTGSRVLEPGFVFTATFAPDGRSLVTSGTDGAVNLWTVPGLDRIAQPLQLGIGANSSGLYAFYAPDGDIVGLAQDPARPSSTDVRWFDLPARPAELAATACQLAGAAMAPRQWRHYVPDQPFRRVC